MKQKDINYIIDAHRDHSKRAKNAFRKWDGKTPYSNHPIWCAIMISTETSLPKIIREEGKLALLYHDILEDTNKELPDYLSNRVRELIHDMTFPSSAQEMLEIGDKSAEIRLYKLYDKVSNILDGVWMDNDKKQKYSDYTRRLCADVTQNYGLLNIVKIARTMVKM